MVAFLIAGELVNEEIIDLKIQLLVDLSTPALTGNKAKNILKIQVPEFSSK